jgi:RNA polymerase sigma-70 factor (sigma-E family)
VSWHAQRSLRDRDDEAAFERFVSRSATVLLRTAVLLAGNRETAEDLLQVALLRTSRRWRASKDAPEAYARAVLVNLVRDEHRRSTRRVREAPLADAVADPALGHPGHVESVHDRDEVIVALRRLSVRQREVLVLRFFGGLSVAETASATGASEGTVKSYTSRGLERMRELLADPPVVPTNMTAAEVADDD